MSRLHTKLFLLPLTLTLLAAPALAQSDDAAPTHLLRYRFEVGHEWHSVTTQDMKMSMSIAGQNIGTTMRITMYSSGKILSVDGDTARMQNEFTRLVIKVESPQFGVDYDSDDPDADAAMLSGLTKIVGAKTVLTMTDAGKATLVDVPEGLSDELTGQGIDLENMMKQSSIELPKEPVAVGGTWQVDKATTVGNLGETPSKATCKLVSIDDRTFVVEQTVEVDSSEMEMPGGMQIDDVKIHGVNKLDRRTGMSRELTMSTKMKATGQMEMTMDMTTTVAPAKPQTGGAGAAGDAAGVYALTARSLGGDDVALSDYRGKVTLFVNVASECGYTPQYTGLQALHERYADQGFAVLGFPCNQFGGQEPGTAEQIREFCTSKFAVTFPMFAKVDVKGDARSAVYGTLEQATGKQPNWNFCKYLVGKDGEVVAFYPSKVKPDELEKAIEAALAK